MTVSEFAAVVLAGGAARRMGGAAKPSVPVGGVPLLARVLEAAADARPRIVVGPLELTPLLPHGVSLTVEQPPYGGPVAALAAGVGLLEPTTDDVAVLAADLPFLDRTVLFGLRRALAGEPDADAAVLLDADGRAQWLCAVWRLPALASRLRGFGDPYHRAMRDLVEGAAVVRVPAPTPDGPPVWFDCDTEDDVRRAEEWARE